MFKFPDSYNDNTLITSNFENDKLIKHYNLHIDLISNQVATLPSGDNILELANYYRSRASHLFRQEKFLDCINDLIESYKLSNNDNILVSLAYCYEKIGNIEKSLEYLNKFKELHPEDIYINDYIKDISYLYRNDLKSDFEELRSKMSDNSSNLSNISIKYNSQENREIISNKDIYMGESVLEVPIKCILTTEMGKKTDIAKEVFEKNIPLISNHNWIAFILLELLKGKEKWNLWKSYLNILPKKFDKNPIFFEQKYLKYLQGSQCLRKIKKRQLLLLKDYEILSKNCVLMKGYTYKEYIWARTVVITRIFGIVVNGIKTQVLVPYADMLNHTLNPKTRWYFDDKDKVFRIVARSDIVKNESVYDTYGRKCNSRFFVNYGFVLNNNRDNLVLFEFDKTSSYVKFLKKKKWYKYGKVPLEYFIGINNNNLNNFLSIIRYFVCDEKEYFSKSLTPFLYPISISNERNALKFLMSICINHLKRYSKSKTEDLKILVDPLNLYNKLYSKIRNIILICYGEKIIYEFYLKMCIESLRILNLTFDELMKTDFLINGLSGPYKEYINEHICKILNKEGDLDFYLNDI